MKIYLVQHGKHGELLSNIRFPLRGTSILKRDPETLNSGSTRENHPTIKEIEENLKVNVKIYMALMSG